MKAPQSQNFLTHLELHLAEWLHHAMQMPPDEFPAQAIHQFHLDRLHELRDLLKQENAAPETGPLTPREKEIIQLVAKGLTNKEISYQLAISARTVEFHLHSVFEKTNSSKRTEAATYCLTKKWIST